MLFRLLSTFLLAVMLAVGAVQQAGRHGSPRFDPAIVTTVVEAVYPPQSVAWGTVVLEVSLDDSGTITDVRVVHGIPSLTESAEQAVRGWKFQPAKLNGKPVSSKVPVAFSFVPPNVARGLILPGRNLERRLE